MKKKVSVVHFGPGRVGSVFLKQFAAQKRYLEKKYSCKIKMVGIFNTSSKKTEIKKILSTTSLPSILIDTTASEQLLPLYGGQLKKGGYIVTSNKKIITQSFSVWNRLMKTNRVYFETTVGAGLPVISTLHTLQDTGDTIEEITGCFSGTIGFILSRLEKGVAFSQAIREAMYRGFTEPDPRDDLSGIDVGRKALILARIMGQRIDFKKIHVKSLYLKKFQTLSMNEFLEKVAVQDDFYKNQFANAAEKHHTFRYCVQINKNTVSVCLRLVPKSSDLGSLQGSENIVVIKTRRYHSNPIVVKGPGAGAQVTGAGVLADVVKVLQRI